MKYVVVSIALFLAASAHAQEASSQDFVRREGAELKVGSAPFRFIGANVDVMHGARERASVDDVFAAAQQDGLRVVRLWALGEGAADAPAWQREYAFRLGPDGWVESSFEHLDRVIASAKAHDLRVIIVLGNRWGDYGGVPQYLRWVHGAEAASSLGVDDFWASDACAALYRAHIDRVISRRNTVTQTLYRDDPTILAWELINESTAESAAGADALVAWTERMAAYIKSVDPHHLVSAGHIGYRMRRDRALWLRLQRLDGIDFADAHAYPFEHAPLAHAPTQRAWMQDHARLAEMIGKPLIWGEFGDRRGETQRARWLPRFARTAFEQGASGVLVWFYTTWAGSARDHAIYVDAAQSASTLRTRRALRGALIAAAARSRTRASDIATRPLYSVRQVLRHRDAPLDAWRLENTTHVLALDPLEFERADFEATSTVQAHAKLPDHFWGAGDGTVSFRWRAPRSLGRALTLRVRLSSELSGVHPLGSGRDVSNVEVWIDDVRVGQLDAPADDGMGALRELVIEDPALLLRLSQRRTHRLRFVVPVGEHTNGLCIYRDASNALVVAD